MTQEVNHSVHSVYLLVKIRWLLPLVINTIGIISYTFQTLVLLFSQHQTFAINVHCFPNFSFNYHLLSSWAQWELIWGLVQPQGVWKLCDILLNHLWKLGVNWNPCLWGKKSPRGHRAPWVVQKSRISAFYMSGYCSHIFEVSFSSFLLHLFTLSEYCLKLNGSDF